jgi:hypothetical protein
MHHRHRASRDRGLLALFAALRAPTPAEQLQTSAAVHVGLSDSAHV